MTRIDFIHPMDREMANNKQSKAKLCASFVSPSPLVVQPMATGQGIFLRFTRPKKVRRPGWGAPCYFAVRSAAAATAVVAAVVVIVVAAAAAAVAEDQQQDNDPPPVVTAEAATDTVIVAHKNTSRNFVELCCPHSMLFRKLKKVRRLESRCTFNLL